MSRPRKDGRGHGAGPAGRRGRGGATARAGLVEPERWPQKEGDVVLEALRVARAAGEDASAAARLVMQSRKLQSRVRSRAADRLFGMARWNAQLDARIRHAQAVGAGVPATLDPDARERLRLSAFLAAHEGRSPDEVQALCGTSMEAVTALASDAFLDGLVGDERLAARHAMPRWLCRALVDERGEPFADALLGALNGRAPLFVRARDDARALAEELGAGTPAVKAVACAYSRVGLMLEGHVNVRGLPAFQQGRLEVQDEGSQLIALLVEPRPGELVLDACAGAGGKALALAALEPHAEVVAGEPVPSRLAALAERATRAAARIRRIKAGLGEPALRPLEGRVDAVLMDAPCSGTGALRREPTSRWRYGADDVAKFAATQLHLARMAVPLLKPGGRLIYATCSLLREENEAVVEKLLQLTPGLEAAPWEGEAAALVARMGGQGHMVRTWPHVHGTDGFFMARLRRR